MQRSRLLFPVVLLLSASPLVAQRDMFRPYDGPRRLELSASAGYFWSSDWSNLILFESLGLVGDEARRVLLPPLAAAPGAGAQAAITYWKGRLGFRVHGGYAESCITSEPRCGDGRPAPVAGQSNALTPVEVSLKTYSYGVQGVVAMGEYEEPQFFRPYFVVGGGGVTYDPAQSVPRFLTAAPQGPGGVETVATSGPGQYTFNVSQAGLETRFAVSIGAGADFRLPVGSGGLNLRLEVSDHISQSPLGLQLTRVNSGGVRGGRDPFQTIDLSAGAVHNLRANIGLAIEIPLYTPPPDTARGFMPFPIPTPSGVQRERGRSGN
jgi:hypothetical protein